MIELVKSVHKTEQDIFPADKPYSLLYSANTLSSCLREEALEVITIPGSPIVNYADIIAVEPRSDICFSQHPYRYCCPDTPRGA